MDSKSDPSPVPVVDLEVYRRAGPVYRARKAMGLLLPGETLTDFCQYIREERELEDSHAIEDQNRRELSVRNT